MSEDIIIASVLIVDDNPAKLLALAATLDGLKLNVVTATSGTEALHHLLAQDFAAVLLDVNMPVMDGFETATMIRSRPRSEHLPIIFVTAEALADNARLKGYGLGAVDYILSPVLPEILRAKVATFADLYCLRESSEALLRELQATQVIARLGSFVLDIPTGLWAGSAVLDSLLGIDAAYERSLKGWETLIHPDDRAMIMDYFRNEVLGQGKAFDKEYRIVSRNSQTVRWVHQLGKPQLDARGHFLKIRGTIQDVTERQRLLADLELSRQREQEIREHEALQRIAETPQKGGAAQVPDLPHLRESAPRNFDTLVQLFRKALEMSLEQRVLRVKHPIANELRAMAEQLGAFKGGPRDAIEIYVQGLKEVSHDIPPQKAQAYAEEGRLLVLELMGDLVAFYRNQAGGSGRKVPRKQTRAGDTT